MICAPLSSPWGNLHFRLAMRLSSTLVLAERFDPIDTLAALERHEVSAVALLPDQLARIMALPPATLRWYRPRALRVIAVRGPTIPGRVAIPAMIHFGPVLYNRTGPALVTLHSASPPLLARAA
jgi:non-ribosomal peptide synthetase component E (peptide arylation enzyme)